MSYRANYHTHTFRCGHASGDAPDYARVAAAGGCEVLGFSDHTPLPDGRWAEWRMAMLQIDEYEAAVRQAAREQPDMTVLLGMECDWQPEFHGFFRDELLGRRGYNYLIGACHSVDIDGEWIGSFERLTTTRALSVYAQACVSIIESGLFAFIAHPDVIGGSQLHWTAETAACARDICAAAAACKVPLELNANGLRKAPVYGDEGLRLVYPWAPFWAVAAEHGVEVVLSSDAHQPEHVLHGHDGLVAIRDQFGLREADLSHLRGA